MNLSQLSEAQQSRIKAAVKNVPFNDLVGIQLELASPGFAKMSLSVREELKQNNRVVHGGAIASLIDSAAACAVIPLLQENETTTTVDLTVSYLRPIVGRFASASAKVLREGHRLIVLSVEVSDEAGNLAATALTTYLRLTSQ